MYITETYFELQVIKFNITIHTYTKLDRLYLYTRVISHSVKAKKFLCVLKHYAMLMHSGVDV